MILYHRTNTDAARCILDSGFRDAAGSYLTDSTFSGVWLSDRPLDANEGARGDALLEVTTDLSEDEIEEYWWQEEGKSFREFLIPASVINRRMTVRVIVIEDEDDDR